MISLPTLFPAGCHFLYLPHEVDFNHSICLVNLDGVLLESCSNSTKYLSYPVIVWIHANNSYVTLRS